jgi:hypothetical protein
MVDHESLQEADFPAPRRRSFLAQNWPYLLMLVFALAGVAMTSLARQSMTLYWVLLAPLFALASIYARWRDIGPGQSHWTLVRVETSHWLAVLVAMNLVLIGGVKQMMNADASALMTLTILALGTFTAGLQIGAWRICVVGAALALGVPIIAWIDRATLLLLALAVLLLGGMMLFYFHKPSERASG